MKKLISQIILILILSILIFAQDEQAKLIEEFSWFNSESLELNLKVFRAELLANPKMKGYIVTHRGEKQTLGSPIRFLTRIENFFTVYKLPRNRFQIINGDSESKFRTQFWTIPASSKNPFKETSEKVNLTKTLLFDAFSYPNYNDITGCCVINTFGEEEKKSSIAAFAKLLKENSNLTAYVIYYGRYCIDCSFSAVYSKDGESLGLKPVIYLDTEKEISKVIKKERKNFNKKLGIQKDRIVMINGGFRKWRRIELWLVPNGGEIPKPQPNSFPKDKQ